MSAGEVVTVEGELRSLPRSTRRREDKGHERCLMHIQPVEVFRPTAERSVVELNQVIAIRWNVEDQCRVGVPIPSQRGQSPFCQTIVDLEVRLHSRVDPISVNFDDQPLPRCPRELEEVDIGGTVHASLNRGADGEWHGLVEGVVRLGFIDLWT